MKYKLLILVSLLNINHAYCGDSKEVAEKKSQKNEKINLSEYCIILEESVLEKIIFLIERLKNNEPISKELILDEKGIEIIRNGLVNESDIEKIKKDILQDYKQEAQKIIEEILDIILNSYKHEARK